MIGKFNKRLLALSIGAVLAAGLGVIPAVAAEVAARIGTRDLSLSEVDTSIAQKVYDLQLALYDARFEALQRLVERFLFETAAANQGMAVDAFIDKETAIDPASITEEQITELLNELEVDPADITPEAKLLAQVYLLKQRKAEQRQALVVRLKKQYPETLHLERPRYPKELRVSVRGPEDLARGAANAPIKLVIFSGFDCNFCAQLQPSLRALETRFPNQLRIVHRHFPLDTDTGSEGMLAAEAAQCAADQKRFWTYHDALHERPDLDRDALETLAKDQGLNLKAFRQCLDDHRHAERMAADIAEGKRLGVTGVPTLFVNGVKVQGAVGEEKLTALVQQELGDRTPATASR